MRRHTHTDTRTDTRAQAHARAHRYARTHARRPGARPRHSSDFPAPIPRAPADSRVVHFLFPSAARPRRARTPIAETPASRTRFSKDSGRAPSRCHDLPSSTPPSSTPPPSFRSRRGPLRGLEGPVVSERQSLPRRPAALAASPDRTQGRPRKGERPPRGSVPASPAHPAVTQPSFILPLQALPDPRAHTPPRARAPRRALARPPDFPKCGARPCPTPPSRGAPGEETKVAPGARHRLPAPLPARCAAARLGASALALQTLRT